MIREALMFFAKSVFNGRASYPFELTIDGEPTTYLYSANDLRTYKKVVTSSGTTEDYYLMDGFEEKAPLLKTESRTGSSNVRRRTVAILHKSNTYAGWEYFASGAERECRLTDKDGGSLLGNYRDVNNDLVNEVDFYLYDHLGNTRLNYSPIATTTHAGDPALVEYTINSVMDYFPYGKVLRHYNVTDERYLTTQHERDQETGLDYRGARYYDSDVGRFLSLDPLARDYPSLSDYCYVSGNPILLVDPDGKRFKVYYKDKNGDYTFVTIKRIDASSLEKALEESGNNPFVQEFVQAINYLREADETVGRNILKKTARGLRSVKVHESDFYTESYYEYVSRRLLWDTDYGMISVGNDKKEVGYESPAMVLYHEVAHAIRALRKPVRVFFCNLIKSKNYDNLEEKAVIIRYVNKVAEELGEPTSENHHGKRKRVKSVTEHQVYENDEKKEKKDDTTR